MSSSNKKSDIQYKAAPQGMVNLDEAQGIVECFVAGIGNKDSVGDVCAPGAFGKSLTRRKPRVVWGHNWNDPIGKVIDMYEVPPNDPRLPAKMKAAGIGGLYARVQFNLMSEKGREAFANVAFFGEEQEWSIGYKTINAKFDPQMQANILYEVELYEVSPVLHGANQLTGTISVKSEEQPSGVSVINAPSIDGLNVNELSSILEALKAISSSVSEDEKCGPGMMPQGMPGMPSGGPGMPSGPKPMHTNTPGAAPREVVKPQIPSMPENPMTVALRRELATRTGSNVIVRSASDSVVVFDRVLADGTSSTYRLPFHYAGGEFMFGKPEKVQSQANYVQDSPLSEIMVEALLSGPTAGAEKSLISFDDQEWGEGFGQSIPSQQVDASTLNSVIANLQKIIEQKSEYVVQVAPEHAFEVKQAIDPILDFYKVDATINEDGIVVKSLNEDFLNALDIATKGVLRSLGNLAGRAIDRPNIGRNRRDRTPNLASRGPGIGSRGAVVRLRDGSTWDPKNAPDRNRNGIVGEGLFDSSGRSLAQPDPTPEGPDSIRGAKTPKSPQTPKRQAAAAAKRNATVKRTSGQPQKARQRLSSGGIDQEVDDTPMLEEKFKKEVSGFLSEIGTNRNEIENILDLWENNDADHDKYMEEHGAGSKNFAENVAYAASAMYEDYISDAGDRQADRRAEGGRFSSGEWTKIPGVGYEMDAPDIEGVYEIQEGLDGKFYVVRYSDGNRNGGQNMGIYEHDKPFSTLAAAKKWSEKDYAQAADEYMPDGMEDADSEDGERFSSGQIDFDKIGESGLREMRHVERNPLRFDTQADKDARAAYERVVANFRANNGFFREVPMYAGDKKWHSEDWFRGREMAENVATLRFGDPIDQMPFFDKPGKPSKREFFERTTTVDYRSWYMAKIPAMTQELDRVLASDAYSDEYKEAFLEGMRTFFYVNRPNLQYAPKDTQAQYEEWLQRSGLGWKGRYSTSGPKFEDMETNRFSSGATGRDNKVIESYENVDDLKEAMFSALWEMSLKGDIDGVTAEELADAISVNTNWVEPHLEDVKNYALDARRSMDEYYSSIPELTDEEMDQEYRDWLDSQAGKDSARAMTIKEKFDSMTDEEAADYVAWLEEETWRDRSDTYFSSGERGTPEERVELYNRRASEKNAILESMTPEELAEYAEQWNEDHREDERFSSGQVNRPKSTKTGEEFIGRSYGLHDFFVYDEEDDFENIDKAIVDSLLKGERMSLDDLLLEVRGINDPDLSGEALVRRPDQMGANARRVAEAVANNTSVSPSLANQKAGREDILHFSYNGKQRSIYPETFSTSKKGVGYFVGWDETADNGNGAYRSFNIDKIEGLISSAIPPHVDRAARYTDYSWNITDFSDEDNQKILEQMRRTKEFRVLDDAQDLIDDEVSAGGTRVAGSTLDIAEKEAQAAFQDARNRQIDKMVADGKIKPLSRDSRFSSGMVNDGLPDGYWDTADDMADSYGDREDYTDARFSSGGMPSTKEQADLIAFARSKPGTFTDSVVSQFDRNRRLSEKQWDAIRRMMRGASGGKAAPKADKPTARFSGKRRQIVDIADIEKYDYPELPAKIKPTPEQDRAIDAMMTGADVKIGALAATGKTTTVINFANRLKAKEPDARVVYLVFNRNAKDDVEKRGMPGNVSVSTMDGIAYRAMDAINPEMTKKSFDKKEGHIKPINSFKDRAKYLGTKGMVSQGEELTDVDVYRIVAKAIDAYSISDDKEIGPQHFTGPYNGSYKVTDTSLLPELLKYANKMWEDMNLPRVNGATRKDQKGMLPVNNTHLTKMWALTNPDIGEIAEVNVAMVDEAQDMNPVFAGILRNSNLQKIYIGDTNQAINAWRGADGTTLANVEATYDMPITDSFRFGKNVANMGNRFLSLLNTKERMTGRKTDKSGNPVDGRIGQVDNPTMILTRSNGGAIAATMEVFADGGIVYGSQNFKRDLENFLNNIEWMQNAQKGKPFYTDVYGKQVFSAPEFSQDLDGITNIADFNKAIEKGDDNRLNMLSKLMNDYSLEDLRESLNNIITDKNKLPKNRDEYVHIQTAHTSKGLESPRVKIWSDFRKPKKLENGEWQYPDEQEMRLSYVAVTRAEEELDLGSLSWILDHTTEEDGMPNTFSSGRSKARGNRGDGKGRQKPWSAEDRQRFADRDILRSQTRPGKRRPGPSANEFSSGAEFDFTPEELNRWQKASEHASAYGDWENLPENRKNGYLRKFNGDENLAREQFNVERDLADFAADAQFDKTNSRFSSGGRFAPQPQAPEGWEMPEIGDDGEIKNGPLKGYYIREFGDPFVPGRKYVSYGGTHYSTTDEHKNTLVEWGDYEPGYTIDRNIGSDEDIRGIADSSEQEEMAQYGDEGLYYGNSSRGRYDPQNDYETSVTDDSHSPENGEDHIGKAVSVTDENGNKFYGVVVRGWEPEYEEDLDVDEDGWATPSMNIQDGGMVVLATHDADGKKLDKPVVVEASFGLENEYALVSNVERGGDDYEGPKVNVSKGRVSEETLDEAKKLYEELDPYRNGKADEFRRQGALIDRTWRMPGGEKERREKAAEEAYRRSPEGIQEQREKLEASISAIEDKIRSAESSRESLMERLNDVSESGDNVLASKMEEILRDREGAVRLLQEKLEEAKAELDAFNGEGNRLSSGRFAPDGQSGSRLQRRLSSGDVFGPPPGQSARYDRKKQVEATMGAFHSDPGMARVSSDAEGILGKIPSGKNSHVLNLEAAKRIIADPDGEYSAETGWPVDAGRLLDFIQIDNPLGGSPSTLRDKDDAQLIARVLGIPASDAQDMLDGKPVYIASSTAADMFDNLSRTKEYTSSVGGLNDVARVWGFDGAPKWVRHSDIATPEFDLDENDRVNWSQVKWDGLSRADFDAAVRRGNNPPEPVYTSPVEFFNSDAIASNPKWDARGGSFRNPTVDAEFTATPKKVSRAEQLEPERFVSQARAGERVARADKDFMDEWTNGSHGIGAAQLMQMLGLERDSEGDRISSQDVRKLLDEINKIKEEAGSGLVPAAKREDGKFKESLELDTKKSPINDEIMHALIVSGRFKNMKEAVASLGDPRLDSLAAEYDSRMLVDAAFIRIKDHLNKVGAADQKKILSKVITAALGRKTTLESRVQEGRASIKGVMNSDAMIGDEKLSEVIGMVNEVLEARGLETIDKDALFPRDEAGGFVNNLSASAPGATRLASGQRFVARTASSRRADAGMDAAARRATDRPTFSSGAKPAFRDPDGKLNATNMRDAASEATIPEGTRIRKTPGQNIEDFEKAVKTRAEIAETLNIDTSAINGFTVYDVIDELKKAGIPEDTAEDLVDKLVELDFYIDAIEERFSEAREIMDEAIEEAEDAMDKIAKLRKERADIINRYGEEDGQPLLEVVDEKISRATKKLDDAYQRGIGNEDARMGTLYSQVDEILSNNRGWREYSPSPYRDSTNQNLAALELAIAKAGGVKKAVPVTGIDFGVPEGTRLSSGKAEEYYQNLTSHLINMIEKSQKEGGKWEAPWHKAGNLPRNASTKNMYSGGNIFALMLAAEEKGFTTSHWGGFQQWKKLGGSVKKGEKATIILMPKQMFGEEIDPDTGQKVRKSKGVYFTTAHVFNLDQVEGIDRDEFLKLPTDALTPEQRVTKLEDAIKEVGATIKTGDGSRAYYSPREDHVVMPPFELFKSPEGYYGTLAHELVHWTGHSSRLDRKNMNQFGSPDYAREELIAEFGSAFLLAMFGLSAEPREDHAHYLANWLQVLRDEPNALQEAATKAQEASKMLIEKMKAVLEEMGETASSAESDIEEKNANIFTDPLYGIKNELVEWSKNIENAPYFIKSLTNPDEEHGNVNRRWERIAEAALFLNGINNKI
jgi:HK97 family phage prohead protease